MQGVETVMLHIFQLPAEGVLLGGARRRHTESSGTHDIGLLRPGGEQQTNPSWMLRSGVSGMYPQYDDNVPFR